MYYNYFGLNCPPFKITPDTRLFFPGGSRGSVLQSLAYTIANGEGIVKVVGEVGTGKTMLCRMLEASLPDHVEVVYLANPSLSPENLLHAVAFELQLGVSPSDKQLKVLHLLQDYLVKKHAENRRVVMFVEEAQSMPVETLEELRLLSNLETQQEKLLQIVLFGQPELDEKLSAQNIRQLRERITYSFYLPALKAYEVRDYINARLRICGYASMDLFTPRAIRQTARYSCGLLRRVNIIADKACLAAYADNSKLVRPKHVKIAVQNSDFPPKYRWIRWTLGLASSIGCVGVIIVWFLTSASNTLERAPDAASSSETRETVTLGMDWKSDNTEAQEQTSNVAAETRVAQGEGKS